MDKILAAAEEKKLFSRRELFSSTVIEDAFKGQSGAKTKALNFTRICKKRSNYAYMRLFYGMKLFSLLKL